MRYQLIFEGELSAGTDQQDAVAAFAKIFKISEELVSERFFAGPISLKKLNDEDTANQYRVKLLTMGIVVTVRAIAEEPQQVEPATSDTAVVSTTTAAPLREKAMVWCKAKVVFGVFFVFAVLTLGAFGISRQFCLLGSGGEICYQSGLLKSWYYGRNLYKRFYDFVQENGDKSVVYLSPSIEEHYGDSAYDELRNAFKWIEKDSLKYVVLDGDVGALLLMKEDQRGVVYFNLNENKIVVDFDTDTQFLPIDLEWVNERYGGGYSSGYVFDSNSGDKCFYQRGTVFFFGERACGGW